MKTWFGVIFLVLFVGVVGSCSSRPVKEIAASDCGEHSTDSFHCVTYLSNYDGDTVTFEIPNVHSLLGHKMPIRLRGIDTPEVKTNNRCEKERGLEAKQVVAAEFVKAKRVDLVNCAREKYFRLVCTVLIDGQDLSQKLLNEGYAYAYDGGTKQKVDWCRVKRLPAHKK